MLKFITDNKYMIILLVIIAGLAILGHYWVKRAETEVKNNEVIYTNPMKKTKEIVATWKQIKQARKITAKADSGKIEVHPDGSLTLAGEGLQYGDESLLDQIETYKRLLQEYSKPVFEDKKFEIVVHASVKLFSFQCNLIEDLSVNYYMSGFLGISVGYNIPESKGLAGFALRF